MGRRMSISGSRKSHPGSQAPSLAPGKPHPRLFRARNAL